MLELLSGACLPERHRRRLDGCEENGRWCETLQRLTDKIGSGFIVAMIGPRGTGKTQLAANLISDACAKLRKSRYIKALDLFREMRSAFRDDGEPEIELVKRFVGYDLLVIDEAHERGHTEFEGRTLTNMIDSRYDRCADTLLVSNDTAENFAKAVGPSIMSRLNETGEIIEADWPSFR